MSFNNTNGEEPFGGLIFDANGDLFGTTLGGGSGGYGTVFEIKNSGTAAAPVYDATPTTLVTFNNTNGAHPEASLIVDANGDLFGTTLDGGSGYGTVFEIKNNGTVTAPIYDATPTTLVSFNNANGAYPYASLIVDANGDLFGTTYGRLAQTDGNGTVFEIKNNGTVAAPIYDATPTTTSFQRGRWFISDCEFDHRR